MLSLLLAAWFLLTPKSLAQLRRAEVVSGLLAAGLGATIVLAVVFVPLPRGRAVTTGPATVLGGSSSTASVRIEYESLWQEGMGPRLWTYLIAVLLLLVGTALGAYLHGRLRLQPALLLLWVSAGMLTTLTLIGIMSIGLAFLPATGLALAAAIDGARCGHEPEGRYSGRGIVSRS